MQYFNNLIISTYLFTPFKGYKVKLNNSKLFKIFLLSFENDF